MLVQCELCPKMCVLDHGMAGDCRIRVNLDGRLTAVTYGHPASVHVDPVEKKPLYHFLPGSRNLSLATVGCNLHCRNCQNWQISQCNPEDSRAHRLPAADIPALARRHGCLSVSYTYTDPVVYYEYALDAAVKCREAGLRNVLVTAAYINRDPWRELCRFVDAANIDLKALSDRFYREVCDGSLQPVLEALVAAKTMGVAVEVTNLIIPTMNDADADIGALCAWVRENLGAETPLHFSRFSPQYRLAHLPPTAPETLERARQIAQAAGLKHVYIGNLLTADAGTTFCPGCGAALLRRRGYQVQENRLADGSGRCPDCGREVHGIWK